MLDSLFSWPVVRQIRGSDPLGRGSAARSSATADLRARTATADRVVTSVCPYCAVGCSQQVYVKDDEVVQIEGNPASPVSRGRLCPKGSASLQLTTGDHRQHQVLYRRPNGSEWEHLDLDTAMEMVADRVLETRARTFQWNDEDGVRVRRTMGIASLGGATLDNEENYLIKKLFTALGVVQVENQARICHSSTVAALGTSFGRGGATTYLQDMQNSDCIVIQGSNFAENHPVGFQWVMEAKARGATVIHVDPRFNRTSALSDLFVPIRPGTDIVFLGALVNHVLSTDSWFKEYLLAYTNASTLIDEGFEDVDVDGVFSGLDAEGQVYDNSTWQYEGADVQAASGNRDTMGPPGSQRPEEGGDPAGGGSEHAAGGSQSERTGSGGVGMSGRPDRDETLEDPRCVLQILRRHYARYTPEMVEEVCGTPPEAFARMCQLITANSGRERTTEFVYAMGWTQHTTGVQNIRTACILQLLLGNIGRPGGGIQALRGHASIQGSSDIPTLYNLLPGYIPMPHGHRHTDLDSFVEADAAEKGYWANMRDYTVSLLKSWWGDAATAENDFAFDFLPRITGDHSTYATVQLQQEGVCEGYFLMGENPAGGSANASVQRLGMANLKWLVVRDLAMTESATWWKDGPEIETGELRTEDIGTEVFFFPAAAHIEKKGSFTNTNRMLQWHDQAVDPKGDARSDLWFMYHLGRIVRERLADSPDEMDRPVRDLTWDYPVEGPTHDPDAQAVLAEINGYDADGNPLTTYVDLVDDGSTRCGCWIYAGCRAEGENQARRRRPHWEQSWVAPEWGWTWPLNRHILYNRASADPDGQPWSDLKALVWWDADEGRWTGHDVPDFKVDMPPDHRPPADATGPEGLSGAEPFIMQGDGRGWLFVPAGLADGPLPTHYEPEESPVANPMYRQQHNPVRLSSSREHNLYQPSGDEPGADVYPFVVTTYRLTEHFTAGAMTRNLPYLAELQPEMFCEVSPELAAERGLEHAGWATVVTARGAIEARVLVTDRVAPMTIAGRTVHQIGLPYHWGRNGLATGDAVNELTSIVLDPNVHIEEVKALTADIQPGRRPRGPELTALVASYRHRAGITEKTGTEVVS